MHKVARRGVGETPLEPNFGGLALRLLALRSEIDAILGELGRMDDPGKRRVQPLSEPALSGVEAAALSRGSLAGKSTSAGCSATDADEPPGAPGDEDDEISRASPFLAALSDPMSGGRNPASSEHPLTGHRWAAPGPLSGAASEAAAFGEMVDDLTLVRGIDADLAARLNGLGVTAFAEIARWSRDDVTCVSDALHIARRISNENWIEQAAVLASGNTTAFAKRRVGATALVQAMWATCDARPGLQASRLGMPWERETETGESLSEVSTTSVVVRMAESNNVEAPTLETRGVKLEEYWKNPAPSAAPRRGRHQLIAKVVACIAALLAAGILITVDRSAWGWAGAPSTISGTASSGSGTGKWFTFGLRRASDEIGLSDETAPGPRVITLGTQLPRYREAWPSGY